MQYLSVQPLNTLFYTSLFQNYAYVLLAWFITNILTHKSSD